jgi:hypothetical protein
LEIVHWFYVHGTFTWSLEDLLSPIADSSFYSKLSSAPQLVAMVVAVIAFSAAADTALSPLENYSDKIFDRFQGKEDDKDTFLYKRIRRAKFVKLTELFCQIFFFILIGVIASQIVVAFEKDPEAQWTWMTSFYWAIQTATTIG